MQLGGYFEEAISKHKMPNNDLIRMHADKKRSENWENDFEVRKLVSRLLSK